MRAVIQRVLSASVAVDGKTISSIGKGLLVLVGIDRHDGPSDSSVIVKRILNSKLFDDGSGGMWKKSVKDIDGEVLCVSQFTLFSNFKGSKPDFHESMSTNPGRAFYSAFLDEVRAAYLADRVKDGQFGAMMQVSLTNDGPVTILLSSRDEVPSKATAPETEERDAEREKAERLKATKEAKRAELEVRTAANAKRKEDAKREAQARWDEKRLPGKADSAGTDSVSIDVDRPSLEPKG